MSVEIITTGQAVLGIELGSTRIKAVLIDEAGVPLASGSYEWENQLLNGIWTYSLDQVWQGLQESYRDLKDTVKRKYGISLTKVGAIGISAMMHGYLAFDSRGELLVPFRTWRNTMTQEAVEKLTEVFQFNIPQRWSIAHLYQAILNREPHVKDVAFLTTLSGYVHWKLTGEQVLGVGDASGMFPIDPVTRDFNQRMAGQFDELIADRGYSWKFNDIFPRVLLAGEAAGSLTEEGARLLDPSGELAAGILLCPPEGDAGTGMAATNSVGVRTGNVSAGTSIFAMVVMDRELTKVYPQIDMVTTPDGSPVAMVHCNNCTSDLNAWISLLEECLELFGTKVDKNTLYTALFESALKGEADCGGLLSYNYLSGEPVTDLNEGRPLFVRMPDGRMTLANFMRTHLYSALGALKAGLDILFKEEQVPVERLMGHGGFFKTPVVGQRMMAAAVNAPIAVMETAGEGGAWGIALLAAYRKNGQEKTLQQYLDDVIFDGDQGSVLEPVPEDVTGFDAFMEQYLQGLPIERAAAECLK